MIVVKKIDNTDLVSRYSDIGKMLLQNETGILYSSAVDLETAPYTYTEVDNPNINNGPNITEDEMYDIILGGEN